MQNVPPAYMFPSLLNVVLLVEVGGQHILPIGNLPIIHFKFSCPLL